MRPVLWMVAGSAMGWLVATALVGTRTALEIFLGMIGPLAVAAGTWMLTERTYRLSPERVTPLMVAAFVGKMVFFAAYVTIGLRVLSLQPIPFVVSFTGYFIALHLTEALCLRRLFAGSAKAGHCR